MIVPASLMVAALILVGAGQLFDDRPMRFVGAVVAAAAATVAAATLTATIT